MTAPIVLTLRHVDPPSRVHSNDPDAWLRGLDPVANPEADAVARAGFCLTHPVTAGSRRPPKSRGLVYVVNEGGQSLCPECEATPTLLAGRAVLAVDAALPAHAGPRERALLDSLRDAESRAGESEIQAVLCALEPVVRRNGPAARELRALLLELLDEPPTAPASAPAAENHERSWRRR